MKLISCTSIVILLFILPIVSNAAVITWIGGTGLWNEESNWDTDQVPKLNDGVIISSGTVIVDNYAEANHIHLNGGNLEVYGTLYVEPDKGWYRFFAELRGMVIESGSSFNNYGTTAMEESPSLVDPCIFIFCNGTMTNHGNGLLYLNGDQSKGIHTYLQSGTVYNYGEIEMPEINSGIYLLRSFENYGDIYINSTNSAIYNRESFFSSTTSNIEVHGSIVNGSNSVWNQFGNVDVNNTSNGGGHGVSINGLFEIQNSGSLTVDGANSGVHVSQSGTLRIRGNLAIESSGLGGKAISNKGFIVNHQKGIVSTDAEYGVYNDSGSELRNFGIWNMNDPNDDHNSSLTNLALFSNRPKGKLYVEGKLRLGPSTTFNNQGHMFVLDDVEHVLLLGQFNNTGTLNDVYSRMTLINNNTSIRVHNMMGPFTEGVPVPNILDLGSSPGAIVLNWYTTASGNTIAGTYDSNSNTFTPNSNAVGLNSLFVRTRIKAGGETRRHEMIVENGIIGNPSPMYRPEHHFAMSANTHASISPNPVRNNFSIKIENSKESKLKYSVYNSMGQIEFSGDFDALSNSILLPEYLPSGMYFIRITNAEGMQIDTTQIRVLR